jgi:predicted HAD superfamily Cof-like phosphohydrolase
MRANGEDFIAAVHQQHLLVADMAEELAVDKIRQRDALGEVRTVRRILFLGHR